MKFSGRVKGQSDLVKAFQRLEHSLSRRVMLDALTQAAEPMRAEASQLAPRGRGRGPHLADNIITAQTNYTERGQIMDPDVVAVAIGPMHKPDDFFYGMFQEMGTAHHPAHPFMRPAFDSQRKGVMRQLAPSLWAAMKRRQRG